MTTEETRARIKQQAAELRAEIEAREQRRREAEATPPAYLSHSAGYWRVIVQGLPICADKRTEAEATAAAHAQRGKLAAQNLDHDKGDGPHQNDTAEQGNPPVGGPEALGDVHRFIGQSVRTCHLALLLFNLSQIAISWRC